MSMNISNIQGNLSLVFKSRKAEVVALLSTFTIVSVAGVTLSAILFVIILSRQKLRTGSGILIAHHQLLHVLQTGISNPFYIVTGWAVWLGSVDISGINCTIMHFFCQLFICAETWASLFLALNRFVALLFPHQYGTVSSSTATAAFVVAAWIISTALNVPAVLGIGSLFGMRQSDCGYIRVTSPHILNTIGTLGVYFPEVLQGILYTMILVVHYCSKPAKQTNSVQRKKFVLFLLLFGSYLWYVACYLPFLIVLYGIPRFWFADKIRAGWFIVLQQIGYAGSPTAGKRAFPSLLSLSEGNSRVQYNWLNDFVFVFLLLMNKDLISSAKEGMARTFCKVTSISIAPGSRAPPSSHLALSVRRP